MLRRVSRAVALRQAKAACLQMRCMNLNDVREHAPIMFCYQCEQTNQGTGCDRIGMCGKRPRVAILQDLTVHIAKGISQYAHAARKLNPSASSPEIDRFVLDSLFATMTNVNNDRARFVTYVKEAVDMLEKAKALYKQAGGTETLKGPAEWSTTTFDEEVLSEMAEEVGVLNRALAYDEDTFSLIELITYGVKGMAAYAHHAMVQGKESDDIYAGIHMLLSEICDPNASVATLLPLALKAGEINVGVMALLENAHISSYGVPTPKQVNTTPIPGKCILVSGHDIQDMFNILKQTEGTGINVYTHGELLPAHGYPELQKFPHFAGHYGGAWQKQRIDFNDFPGAIVMTTNCMIEPKSSYKKRIFTRQTVGWPGIPHITGNDYSEVIKCALACDGFKEGAPGKTGPMTTGFGADAILANAETVVNAIKNGDIKHFYVIGGCDGRESSRSYFTDLAKAVPKDSVILTLGCGKFRFNTEDFGDIGGVPRLLDVGQCNDAYGAVRVALALKDALGVSSVNDLPISFGVSWFEQKAVAVLLSLLYLDVKNIHLGPRLPAFVTPNVLDVLVKTYGISPVGAGPTDAIKMRNMPNNHLASSA
eukprot:TRINITY_DN37_c0_g1_i2.p1 TRINITY_DN37_c0_g1~~TRINITY_DN37_c0_g1_i2.p1  ORF type:complete len:611 (+),score=257.56 TRINITY_DN37_c0_g1_i2:53-1834(+)